MTWEAEIISWTGAVADTSGGGANDKLKGGGGKDVCVGGKGNDSASKCEVEKSI